MSSLALMSSQGRMSRGMFALAILAIYVLSFLSQMLLSGAMINRGGLWLFAIVQAALTWGWYVAHARRLRDAGQGSGLALGIAIVYALAVVLLLLIVVSTMAPVSSTISPTAPPPQDEPTLMTYFLVMYLLATLFGGPMMGLLGYVLVAIALLLLSPVLIAFAYSIWAATRPPVRPSIAVA